MVAWSQVDSEVVAGACVFLFFDRRYDYSDGGQDFVELVGHPSSGICADYVLWRQGLDLWFSVWDAADTCSCDRRLLDLVCYLEETLPCGLTNRCRQRGMALSVCREVAG